MARTWRHLLLLTGLVIAAAPGARATAVEAIPIADQSIPAAEDDARQAEEVLWRQVTLEDGRVVVVRDRLVVGEGAMIVRDAFVIRDGEVVNRLPLDPRGLPIEQVVLQLGAQPLTGLSAAESPQVMSAIAWLERPRPDPADLPDSVLAHGPDPVLRWQKVELASGRVMVYWDRMAPGGSVVRDAFLVERAAVARHLVVDPARDPVAFAATYAVGDEQIGQLEPATEQNILVVADYLDDHATFDIGILESDFDLQQSFSPSGGGGVVSPAGGVGGN